MPSSRRREGRDVPRSIHPTILLLALTTRTTRQAEARRATPWVGSDGRGLVATERPVECRRHVRRGAQAPSDPAPEAARFGGIFSLRSSRRREGWDVPRSEHPYLLLLDLSRWDTAKRTREEPRRKWVSMALDRSLRRRPAGWSQHVGEVLQSGQVLRRNRVPSGQLFLCLRAGGEKAGMCLRSKHPTLLLLPLRTAQRLSGGFRPARVSPPVPVDGSPSKRAADVAHGYAVTPQEPGRLGGPRHALADLMTDRHAAYVAMTRQRKGVHLYADREAFGDRHPPQPDRVAGHTRSVYYLKRHAF